MREIMDIKLWIVLGIILGFVIGFDHPDAPMMLIITLMIQMTLALQGLKFNLSDLKDNRKEAFICLLFCFGLNTALTLLMGLLFIDNTALWYGWIMLSAVPCAISVMTMTFYMKGDLKLGMLGFSCIYIFALVLTPIITHFLMGEAASWVKILEYVVLFVVVPVVIDIPLNRVTIPPTLKIMVMNVVIMVMVFISVGFRKDYMIANPDVALMLLLANMFRIFVPSLLLIFILKRMNYDREKSVVYIAMSTWRNSGLAATLCIVMFSTTYPDALLPAVLSLMVENLWFVIMQGSFDKIWPKPAE
ncbi:sodium bile acid symporter family protein [methanogenic archaeon mixed culture ISO4-G1]|nr:sodium bile acid symporter family protein [methanogenic archaeon mixed culture ISO4-G1]